MRVSKTWIVAILAAVGSVQAADPPKQKPGMWEITTAQNGGPTPMTLKVCIDEKTSQFYLGVDKAVQKSCTKLETHVSGSTVTKDAVCKFGGTYNVTTHGVTTFQGDGSYKAEAHSHWDPPLVGKTDTVTTVTGKWMGATCASGMKPGDIMTPEGKIISANLGAKAAP